MEDNITKRKLHKHRLLFFFTMVSIIVYIVWRIFFTLPTRYGVVALFLGILLLLAEVGASFEAIVNYSMLSKYEPPELPVMPDDWYPEIDIFIATHNEPVDMLYSTVNSCLFMDYPDKKKIHVHLCDDNGRPEMQAMAEEMGINYWGMPENRDAKGGNLNNGIRRTHAPIIITLDADMVPRHEFLMQTVPHFYKARLKKDSDGNWIPKEEAEINEDEKIGFLQTPQGFYNPDLFQFNLYSEDRIPGEQDLFFREINVARSAYNASIYAGSNTLILREALEEVEYIALDTITEDILTGLRIQKLGYQTLATSDVLVQGQAPVTVKGLINQRERWGRGCIDALRQEPVVTTKRLSFAQKISYITCWVFWWTYARRAIFLAAPIITALFNINIVQADFWQVLIFWLPYYLLFNRSLRVMSGDVWNQHWSNVADTILFPYILWPIIAEQIGIKQKKFKVTEKKVEKDNEPSTLIFGLPHILVLGAMLLSLFVTISSSIASGTVYSPIILYWMVIGTKNLLFAVFFMYGRENLRGATRFYFQDSVSIRTSDRIIETEVSDVSETGMAFYFDNPEYIKEDTVINIIITYRNEEITLPGRVVHIATVGTRWKYSVELMELSGRNKRYYRQYVYDRHHSLPTRLDPSISIIDDFNLQLGKRAAKVQQSHRKLPRVPLDIPLSMNGERSAATLADFNYLYAVLKFKNESVQGTKLYITISPDFHISLEKAEGEENKELYRVLDSEKYTTDDKISSYLKELSLLSPKEKAELIATISYQP